LKEEYPDRILIASIMEEYDKAAWQELIERVEETGVVHYASSIFFS
jgi:dihydropyrimidine dehydrogenase (NADP+)